MLVRPLAKPLKNNIKRGDDEYTDQRCRQHATGDTGAGRTTAEHAGAIRYGRQAEFRKATEIACGKVRLLKCCHVPVVCHERSRSR